MPSKVFLTVEGHVRQIKVTEKTVKFAIPVYAGGKDENVKTKWFNFTSFEPEKYQWLENGTYVRVSGVYVSVNEYKGNVYEEWIISDKFGKVVEKELPAKKEEVPPSKEEDDDDGVIPF